MALVHFSGVVCNFSLGGCSGVRGGGLWRGGRIGNGGFNVTISQLRDLSVY